MVFMVRASLIVRKRQKAWIESIQKKTGHSFSLIAKNSGLAPTTVSRFMDDAQSSGALTAQTEEKIRISYPEEDSVEFIAFPKESHLNSSYGVVQIPEYDIKVSAGPGSEAPDRKNIEKSWSIPRRALSAFVVNPDTLVIVTVVGDSMEPDYQSGERVLVDTGGNFFTHDGIYVLDTGFGLVIKQLQLVLNTTPQQVRVISKNASYPLDVVPMDSLRIIGRVVGKWVWK